jgi:hypothetical protein
MLYLIYCRGQSLTVVKVTCKTRYPYHDITPRQTGYRHLAAKLILLMRFSLGDTACLWSMKAINLVFISSLLANNTRYDL